MRLAGWQVNGSSPYCHSCLSPSSAPSLLPLVGGSAPKQVSCLFPSFSWELGAASRVTLIGVTLLDQLTLRPGGLA